MRTRARANAAAGALHTLAIKTDGSLWAWGSNVYGQLGDGTFVDKINPVQVGSATDWASVTAGEDFGHSVAIKKDGSLWAWGYNRYGQLGDGTLVDKNSPVQVGSATDWASVDAGGMHTIAIKTDGTLWAWGDNGVGQLGDGTWVDKNGPVQVGSAADWAFIGVGYEHSIAIKTDHSLWAWGYNFYGQLGDATREDKNDPTQI